MYDSYRVLQEVVDEIREVAGETRVIRSGIRVSTSHSYEMTLYLDTARTNKIGTLVVRAGSTEVRFYAHR